MPKNFFMYGRYPPPIKLPSSAAVRTFALSLDEGIAVNTFGHGRVALVSADVDHFQCAEVLLLQIVCALLHGAVDIAVFLLFHQISLLLYSIYSHKRTLLLLPLLAYLINPCQNLSIYLTLANIFDIIYIILLK